MSAALDIVHGAWSAGLKREHRLTVSQWADEHRELTGISARRAGAPIPKKPKAR